jgi:WD40 repeat protein
MKYLFLIIALSLSAFSQSLIISNIDQSDFPIMKADLLATDADGNQITNINPNDVIITENGVERNVIDIECPTIPPKDLSVCVMVDSKKYINLIRNTVVKIPDLLDLEQDEMGITIMNRGVQIHQDFSDDYDQLINAAQTIPTAPGVDVDAMFYSPVSGGVPFIKDRITEQKVLILVSDLHCPNLNVNEAKLIQDAKDNNIAITAILLGTNDYSGLFTRLADATGGLVYEYAEEETEIDKIYEEIISYSKMEPCKISWESDAPCTSGYTSVEISFDNQKAKSEYENPIENVASLQAEPRFIYFGKRLPSSTNDTTITLTAINADFTVTEINRKYGSADFSVINTNFPLFIPENSSRDITLSFAPSDSSMKFGSFEIETDKCKSYFSANGGFPGIKINNPTIKLTRPNGGETFFVGSDAPITWEGLSPSDTVSLDYSIDEGATWNNITTKATGLEYNWLNVPEPESSQCLVRVSQSSNQKGSLDSVLTLTGHTNDVISVAYSPDGSQIVSGSWDKTIKIWDASTGAEIRTLTGHTNGVISVAYSPDGSQIASGSDDNTMKIWDALTGTEIRTLRGHKNDVRSVAYSPDGSQIASGSLDFTIKLWDSSTGAEIRTLRGHTNGVISVAYSPGSQIASGSDDNTMKIWDALTGTEIRTLRGHTNTVYSVAYSPDGSQIASGSSDKTIKIWDALTGTEIRTLRGHTNTVYSVAYSPDGSQIASGSRDEIIKIWDALTGTEIRTLTGHTDYVFSVAYSPNGSQIASGSYDNTIKIWEVNTAPLQEDESDAVFSIVNPRLDFKNINMGKVLVGDRKDTLVTATIFNPSLYPINVTGMEVSSGNTDDFFVPRGAGAFTLEPDERRDIMFGFTPREEGQRSALISLYTETLGTREDVIEILGEGIQPQLELQPKQIDLGKILVGESKDTLVTAILKNIGTASISIDNSQISINNNDFEILSNDLIFNLNPDESQEIELRFTANKIGRVTGLLDFEFNGVGSPLNVQLYGEGIGVETYSKISITEYTQQAGEEFIIDLKMIESENMDSLGAPRDFEAELSYNGSILYFEDGVCENGFDCKLNIAGTWDGVSENIYSIPAVATLGNTEFTDIEITDFEWKDSQLETDIDLLNGSLTIDGICEDEAVRLYHVGDVPFSIATRPQPFDNELTVQIGMRETLTIDILLLDLNGIEIKKFVSAETLNQGKFDFNFDTSDLNAGVYYIRLISNKGELLNKVIKE